MQTFKQYLEDRQMMMFSTKAVELYHGSNTGSDNSVLHNFLQNGIKSDIAHGYGQGSGFYVWSDRDSAINHSQSIVKDSISTRSKSDGNPMIVTIRTIIEPDKWDMDYEFNKKIIVDWLYDNFDKIQPLVHSDDVKMRQKMFMPVRNVKDELVPSKGLAVQFGRTRTGVYSHSDSNIRSGEIIGTIINRLQSKDPETVYKFEELFFANMKAGVAIKYVGQEPLQIKRIEVFKDGKWVQN